MQHSRIMEKWTTVEKKILEEHLEDRKSAAEFRRWQEVLEDPKPRNHRDGAEDPFQDLEIGWG